jgi:hypothetical protein
VVTGSDPFQIIQSFKSHLNVAFFMDVLIIMSWTIWMARNDLIFKGINPTLHAAQERFKEFALVILRAKESNKPHMHLWLQSIM